METQVEESVGRRYALKLFGNVTSGFLTFLSHAFISRALGPGPFGVYTFIQAHLEHVFVTADFGFSQAFFTSISQDRRRYLVQLSGYFLVLLCLCGACFAYIYFVGRSRFSSTLWPDVEPSLMMVGFWLGLGIFLGRRVSLLADAAGLASRIEVVRVARAVAFFIIVLVLAWLNRLSLIMVVGLTAAFNLMFVVICGVYGHIALRGVGGRMRLSPSRRELKSLWTFARPLAIYMIVVFPFPVVERWLLQYVGGAVQQGYFGLAVQMGLPVFFLVIPLTPIFQRETAAAFGRHDLGEVRALFHRFVRKFFCLTSVLSLFLCVNVAEVLDVVGGDKFAGARVPVALMLLLPIVQATGELSMAFLLATNRTRSYMWVGIFKESLAFVVGYALVAPQKWVVPGLGLGATGLAIKFLVGQSVATSLMFRSNCKYLQLSFAGEILTKISLLLGLGSVAFASRYLATWIAPGVKFESVLVLILGGLIFFPSVGALLLLVPGPFGVERDELRRVRALAYGLFRVPQNLLFHRGAARP